MMTKKGRRISYEERIVYFTSYSLNKQRCMEFVKIVNFDMVELANYDITTLFMMKTRETYKVADRLSRTARPKAQ